MESYENCPAQGKMNLRLIEKNEGINHATRLSLPGGGGNYTKFMALRQVKSRKKLPLSLM